MLRNDKRDGEGSWDTIGDGGVSMDATESLRSNGTPTSSSLLLSRSLMLSLSITPCCPTDVMLLSSDAPVLPTEGGGSAEGDVEGCGGVLTNDKDESAT